MALNFNDPEKITPWPQAAPPPVATEPRETRGVSQRLFSHSLTHLSHAQPEPFLPGQSHFSNSLQLVTFPGLSHLPWAYQTAPGELCVVRDTPLKASTWAAQKVLPTGRGRQVAAPFPPTPRATSLFLNLTYSYIPPSLRPPPIFPEGSLEQVLLLIRISFLSAPSISLSVSPSMPRRMFGLCQAQRLLRSSRILELPLTPAT